MDSFKKAALKLNQAVFVWYLSNFSANKRKEKERKLLYFFTPSKVSYKKGAEKKTNKRSHKHKKLLNTELQLKYPHQKPPTTVQIELSTYGIKI